MKVKLLKRIIKEDKCIDIWQDNTICLLPYINITIVKWRLIDYEAGWLFWSVKYRKYYKPCGYTEKQCTSSNGILG